MSLCWKSALPSSPGWYWMRLPHASKDQIIEIAVRGGLLTVIASNGSAVERVYVYINTLWAGPIAAPAEAKVHHPFRYQLYGSFKAPRTGGWGWNEWEYDRAKVEESALKELAHDSSSVRMIIQERRGNRWGRRTVKEFTTPKVEASVASVGVVE